MMLNTIVCKGKVSKNFRIYGRCELYGKNKVLKY